MSPGADVVVHLAPPGSSLPLERVVQTLPRPRGPVEVARARTCEEAVCLLRWHDVLTVVVLLPFPGLASDRVVARLREATTASVVAVSTSWSPAEERAIRAAGALLCLTPDQTRELERVLEHSLARAADEGR